jgi:aminopeptidase-like protein
MLALMSDLVLVNRSIVGPGYDRALERLGREIDLTVHEFASGDDVWTWKVPNAWDVREAWFSDGTTRYADFAEHPLHLWSHSLPFSGRVSRDELMAHITTQPERPEAIPFDFRYYERAWGFCLQDTRLAELTADEYEVVIDTEEFPGALRVGEHVVAGESEESVLIVAHLDHPGQANDDLAGVAVAMEVARRMAGTRPRLTYRFLFVPEQIGSIAYLSRHEDLIGSFRHGLFLEMLGLDQPLALQHSRGGDDRIDKAMALALGELGKPFVEGRFLEVIVNDEQVLNGPGVGIPTVSLSRATPPPQAVDSPVAQFFTGLPFPEYHTSDDSMAIVSEDSLLESADVVTRALQILDADLYPQRRYRGPVHLSRYGLWVDWRVDPALNERAHHLLWCFEGDKSLSDIALEVDLPFDSVRAYVQRFVDAGLVELGPEPWPDQPDAPSSARRRESPSESVASPTA